MIRKCKEIIEQIQRVPILFWLTTILLFSFLLKLLCWHLDPVVSRDGCLYIQLAQIWHNTGDFQGVLDAWNDFWLPPMLLYLMKNLMDLGLSAEMAGVLLNLTAGTFTPLLAYGIAWEITQRKDIAICSALLIAVNPSMNALSTEVQRDMLYLFFIGLALWLLAAGIRHREWTYWMWTGLVCGCAMLTRFETLEFLVLVPAVLLILCAGRNCPWKKGAGFACIFAVSFLVSILSLSFLMQTQNYLLPNYKRYYQNKAQKVEEQFHFDPLEDSLQ